MSSEADQSLTTATVEIPTTPKPIVVGIYGLPGSGKSTVLEHLKKSLPSDMFAVYEGSAVIASLMGPDRGLDDFHALSDEEKTRYRKLAITQIRDECQKSGLVGVVAGHYMFWPRGSEHGTVVWTKADQDTFTHIFYLQLAAETLCCRRQRDQVRKREAVTPGHLHKWQEEEMRQLDALAKDSGIRFVGLDGAKFVGISSLVSEISKRLHESRTESEHCNHVRLLATVDGMVASVTACGDTKVTTALVFDADKTLTAKDTGREFWKRESSRTRRIGQQAPTPAEEIFREHGYTYEAFRQVAMSYSNVEGFEELCNNVAEKVTLYPEFLSLLRRVKKHGHVMAVVVTCGLRRVWELVMEKQDLGRHVRVIGNGDICEKHIITAKSREAVVNRLRGPPYNLHVVAFGDSPLDLPMLQAADEGVIVVGEELSRSKSMEDALSIAIEQLNTNGSPHNLCQALIPHNVAPRLDNAQLPVVDLSDPTNPFNQSLFGSLPSSLLHASNRPSAKLLMTPTRDANISGPALREAHRRIGWYLATEFITSLIGLEEYSIPHVQGHATTGHRLLREQDTTIVALMRGGEPMAFGVNEAFSLAMFLHAKTPEDVKPHHLSNQHTIILVDSVVNNGKTVLEFRERIRGMDEGKDIHVVVVAGVVQVEATGVEHELGRLLRRDGKLHLVALRVSENKFTGRGGTDTGNRLFGTVRLD